MKRIDNILLGLQYAVAVGIFIDLGLIHDKTTGIIIGLIMLIMTGLYHNEKRNRVKLQEMLRRLPDDRIVFNEATKKASEFKDLNEDEKRIMKIGFIWGAEFIYKKLNAN